MQRIWKATITAVYGLGTVIVATLSILVLTRNSFTPFPDAMLPMELHELASGWLALGFLPMLGAALFFHHVHGLYQKRDTALVFLPAAVCLGFLLFWVVVWTAGLFQVR